MKKICTHAQIVFLNNIYLVASFADNAIVIYSVHVMDV